MTATKYPNESEDYRVARDALLEEENALIERVRAIAEQRRRLPPGGRVPTDYVFAGANDDTLGREIRLSELFGDKDTLLLYSYMFGPNWARACPSCTSLIDGYDRAALSVTHDAAFAVVAAAGAKKLNAWARERGWRDIRLLSAAGNDYLTDYHCQTGDDDKSLLPVMHVFTRRGDEIRHFYGAEMEGNSLDMFWVYWNLMDLTPAGRPDRMTPPQNFRSRYLDDHYLPRVED